MVVDASAVLSFLLPDEKDSAEAIVIRNALCDVSTFLVPAHWWAETTNVIIGMERRKRLTADEVKAVFAVIDSFDVLTDSEAPFRMHREVATLAKRFGLTVYDAAYLELALRDERRLATLDKDLRLAAVALGVECIPS